MKVIKGLQATPFQTFSHTIDTGTIFFTLTFRPSVQNWFIDIAYDTFSVKGLRVCQSLNLLFQWYKIVPFGLLISSTTNTEPFLIDDFSSGRIVMNVLDSDETLQVVELFKTRRDLLG